MDRKKEPLYSPVQPQWDQVREDAFIDPLAASTNASGSAKQEPTKFRMSHLWDPNRVFFRWFTLIFICLITFGSYFVYDNPAAIQNALIAYLNLSPLEYSSLYSVYSIPNTVQVFLGGWLIDRFFGLRLGSALVCGLVLLGQVIFALGVQLKLYWLAVLGRVVFGLGGETLSVAQSAFCAKIFAGKELATAFGITISFSRVGSAVNFDVLPILAQTYNIPVAIWIGALMCICSFVCVLILAFLDHYSDKHKTKLSDVKVSEPVNLWDVRHFGVSVWLVYLICVFFYISIFVFIQFAPDLLKDKFQLDAQTAGNVVALPYTVSACISPFLGFAVDKIGFSLIWVCIASITMTLIHGSLYATIYFVPPAWMSWAIFAVIGVAYSILAASLWPLIVYLVPARMTGTAYGLMTALQNAGLAVAPLAMGAILTASHNNYSYSQIMMVSCAGLASVFSVILLFQDMASGSVLNASAKRRALRAAALVIAASNESARAKDQEEPLLDEQRDSFTTY